ncbi:MAG: aminoacyl-tRNA hydrolase [Candidatus Omnitrophica bacterium]|nr:aminoacyl-tRNA hydrolase [Candidatus Omnitrophota bacterium]
MKLIVGLGNPGLIYAGNRHNIGFTVLKSLAVSLKIVFKREFSASSLVAKGKIFEEDLVLAMPQTFMNLSGSAVKALLKKFKIPPEKLLVVCDDLDLELGRIKIRPAGSSGGHRGLKSIIEQIGTQDFNRLRIGISRPNKGREITDFVLSGFTRSEKGQVKEAVEKAVECCRFWAEKGVTETMNIYNKKFCNSKEGDKSNE